MVYCRGDKTGLNYEGSCFLPIEEIASHPAVDLVMIATSGKTGLIPALAAVKANKK